MLDSVRQDLHYTLRQLRRAPLFTIVASASIAVGVIVAVSAFTLVNAILFKPLPVPNAGEIFHVYTSDYDGRSEPYGSSSFRDYEDFARSGAFTNLAASAWRPLAVAIGSAQPSEQYVGFVSDNYFGVLGLRLQRGTGFGRSDQPEIVITYPYWQREFGGDAAVLGRTININAFPFTIVGVAPESFRGVALGAPVIGWAPATVMPLVMRETDALSRGNRRFTVFGRLRSAQDAQAAAGRLNALATALAEQEPDAWIDANRETRLVSVLSHRESLAPRYDRGDMVLALGAAALAVVFILLLACTNVAALLLGRAVGRQSEVALRLTLGASRARLLRQLLTESLFLALLGSALSFAGLLWIISYARRVRFADIFDLRPDGRVLLAALVAAVLCALAFGLAPALQSLRVDLRSRLTGTSTVQRNRLRGALIALQVAVSSVLILLAFSAVRGVRSYVASDPGIELDGLVAVQIDARVFGDDSTRQRLYTVQLQDLFAGMPAIQSVSRTAMLPLGDGYSRTTLGLPDGTERVTEINVVGSDYFATIRLNALRGRVFDRTDRRGSAPVAVVNHAFVRRYGEGMLGRLVKVGDDAGIQIVGEVPEVDYHHENRPTEPLIYLLSDQFPWGSSRQPFLLRVVPGAERSVVADLRQQLRQQYPDLVVPAIQSMRDRIAAFTLPHRIIARVALGLGGVELLLAAVGLYGLLLFALIARRQEIGVRLALGATPRQATWAVMRQGLTFATLGAATGLMLAVPVAFIAQQAFPGARVSDPVPFLASLTAVLCAAGVAAYLPARKSGGLQPAEALKRAE
ncbi:MAG: ABC transporter permease [Longimicrobiales bacterium]